MVCGVLAGAYTLVGGIRSVVWTDTLQAAVFVLGAGALVAALAGQVEGGIPAILTWGEENGRTRIFHFAPFFSLQSATPFGVGLIGGFFLTLATHSTDQDMVQRLLTTRDGRSGGRALMWSALLNFPLTLLFLFIGSGLALFYAVPPAYEIADTNRILPLFALYELPSGLRGLVFAGLFAAAMSSLDSAICAIATTWVVDIAPRKTPTSDRALLRQTPTSDRALLRQTRVSSAVVCALLIGAAMAAAAYQRSLGSDAGLSLVELALSSMTILYGGLLGLFGVGLFWRSRGSERSAIAGLGTGGALGLLLFVHPLLLGEVVIAWPWWIPIAATVSAAVVAMGRAPAEPTPGL